MEANILQGRKEDVKGATALHGGGVVGNGFWELGKKG